MIIVFVRVIVKSEHTGYVAFDRISLYEQNV